MSKLTHRKRLAALRNDVADHRYGFRTSWRATRIRAASPVMLPCFGIMPTCGKRFNTLKQPRENQNDSSSAD
jgi:hypothetical protein